VTSRERSWPPHAASSSGERGERGERDDDTLAPLVGEVDLHLFGEGRHRRLYTWLGAHVTGVDGRKGTAFTVWAPSARRVQVVGDFNGWDGSGHPMRPLGVSGVWGRFVRGVDAGDRYKYEIHPRHGDPMLKADPMAFATEVPPATAGPPPTTAAPRCRSTRSTSVPGVETSRRRRCR
jgi:1,4-alpha-glucan branching enzyme